MSNTQTTARRLPFPPNPAGRTSTLLEALRQAWNASAITVRFTKG